MHVLATAGHVDHGKSALVRALTGIEPDRWDEERRRGLTIDLGYAWTTLPTGEQVAFVDVPGHERFIGNMLAGLGPVAGVLFVVAADEGWRQQSAEHLAAVDALGVGHGLLVVTRSDLADPAAAMEQARARLAGTSLEGAPAVAVSARTGSGMADLRAALSRLLASLPSPDPGERLRLWVDRAFTIKGSGAVVTGTLGQGSVRVGDELTVDGPSGMHDVVVRGLQSLEQPVDAADPVCRVAVNLRGLPASDLARGDVLLTPGRWRRAEVLDVRLTGGLASHHDAHPQYGTRGSSAGRGQLDLPTEAILHVGTAAVAVRVRSLGADLARLVLRRGLPVVAGDRAIVRDPGSRAMWGALVLDADPPSLARRGAAALRARELARATGAPELSVEVGRRGLLRVADAQALGVVGAAEVTPSEAGEGSEAVVRLGEWFVSREHLDRSATALTAALAGRARSHPIDPSLSLDAATTAAGVPERSLLPEVARRAGLEVRDGRVWKPGVVADLGPAEAGLRRIEERLAQAPFQAPERPELEAAGLGPRELAAAERAQRILRLDDDVVLRPDAPARAMRELAALDQPFTLSQARQALGTTRRVAVPLLEHLDRRGWTRRVDGTHREVRR